MNRFVRPLAALGLVLIAAAVIRRLLAARKDHEPAAAPWDKIQPSPSNGTSPSSAPQTAPTSAASPAVSIVEDAAETGSDKTEAGSADPKSDGSCPTGHPVKAKLSSKIFHVPGGGSYERTSADRCYADAAEAEADGLRQAKR
jgi:hypothetical protein